MKIDWKHLAATPGYMSLKKAYIKDVLENKGCSKARKAEALRKFNWVIGRAKHYASKQGTEVWEVLNKWEAARTYWWVNYYHTNRAEMCRLHSSNLRPRNPVKTKWSEEWPCSTAAAYACRKKWRGRQHAAGPSTKHPAKWIPERKQLAARMRQKEVEESVS